MIFWIIFGVNLDIYLVRVYNLSRGLLKNAEEFCGVRCGFMIKNNVQGGIFL